MGNRLAEISMLKQCSQACLSIPCLCMPGFFLMNFDTEWKCTYFPFNISVVFFNLTLRYLE